MRAERKVGIPRASTSKLLPNSEWKPFEKIMMENEREQKKIMKNSKKIFGWLP